MQIESRRSRARLIMRMALLLLMVGSIMPALAQTSGTSGTSGTLGTPGTSGTPGPASNAARSRSRVNIDEQVGRLAKTLDLSPDQQSAVKSILEQRLQRLGQIRHDPALTGAARIDRFRALQESTVEQIRAVLNDEQKKKYDPLAARKLQPAPEQPTVEDWLKKTTPH